MKNKKLGIALLTLAVFTTTQANNDDNNKDVGSNLLFLPTVAVDMGTDAVTLDQTHQTRKYLDSRDSKKNQKQSSKTESTKRKRTKKNEETTE